MKKKSTSQFGFFNLRVLIGLFVFLAGVSLALVGFGAFSNASAQSNASQAQAQEPKAQQVGETTVIPALHSDLSRPLREQPLIWPPMEAEHEANLNPKIPHQHQDEPDPVIQSSFWQRMINTPAIPAPLLNWTGIAYPGVELQLCAARSQWRGGKDSIRPDGERRAAGF